MMSKRRARLDGGEQVHADAGDAVAKAVAVGVLVRRERCVRIDVGRNDQRRPGARRSQRQNARAGADLADALAGEVERVDELGELFAADEEFRMEHGRPHAQLEAARVRNPDALPREDEIVGEEVDEAPQRPADKALRTAAAAKQARAVLLRRDLGQIACGRDLIHEASSSRCGEGSTARVYRLGSIGCRRSASTSVQG